MILHNGILSPDCVDALLPTAWSYRSSFQTLPQTPNYLKERPDVIPIDCGRQLFVDDFLIEESSLHREFYSPEIKGMVLTPETVLEMDHGNCPVAAPFKDGVFYDPTDKKFKLWYQAGWFGAVAYAESRDGFHWIRPHIAVDGSNRILPAFEDRFRDGCSIWLDQNADTERFKMFLFTRDRQKREYAELRTSANGLDWSAPSRIMSCGDTTSLFYNPFRDRWVLSVRSLYQKGKYLYRYRSYREAASFSELADCRREYFWQSADANDERDDIWDCDTQLYSLDCVAYESTQAYDSLKVMLEAVEKFGPDRAAIKDYIYTLKDWQGVSGTITMSDVGTPMRDIYIVKVEDGKFVQVDGVILKSTGVVYE